ncbi:MAG: MBL fold metallo-hydrolase, partial [Dietzia sp.]
MSADLSPISFPAYETLRPVTELSGVILCDNPSEMTFEGTNTVVLKAPGSPTCVVVDPGPDDRAHAERIAAIVGEIELVVVTHRHGDHTDGIDHLRAFTPAPVRAVEERFCRDAAPLVTGGDDDEV